MTGSGTTTQPDNQNKANAEEQAAQKQAMANLQQWMTQNASPTQGMQGIKGPSPVSTTPAGGGTVGGPSGTSLAPAMAGAGAASGAVPQSVNPANNAKQEMLKKILATIGSQQQAQGGMHTMAQPNASAGVKL